MTENKEPLHIYFVDDDALLLETVSTILRDAGYRVTTTRDSRQAIEDLPELAPDCVISDLMMPDLDGYELCKFVRGHEALQHTKFIVLSAKTYEFDVNRAYEFGAHGFFHKPVIAARFLSRLERTLSDKMELSFWGVRGTLPVCGQENLKYGGHTNCLSLEFPRDQLFVFDGGSGIKSFGNHLMKTRPRRIKGHIFITHPHWDHINALPFFAPLYIQGNEFEILGANQGDVSMREIISAQMEGVYFPITLREFAARVYFRDLTEESFEIDGIKVSTKLLSHPGKCLGYRVDYHGRSVCYISDNELYFKDAPSYDAHYERTLGEFIKGTDALITDVTYTDKEYETRVGWGHTCVSRAVELAHEADVKKLYLHHHDPDQNDADIDAKHEAAAKRLQELGSNTECITPVEGLTILI